MNFQSRLEGEYRIVINRNGEEQDTGWFKNVILNQGLDRLGQQAAVVSHAHVGTGTTTPSITQTGLTTFLAAVTHNPSYASSTVNEGAPNYSALLTYTYPFAQGAVVGNVTEVGVGWATTGNNLFSRALILDGSGNPTTLSITAIDQLTVYYRIRIFPPLTDTTGTLTIGGTPYNYTLRVANVANFANNLFLLGSNFPYPYNSYIYGAGSNLGAITGMPSGTASSSNTNVSQAAYTTGTYYRDATWTWSVSTGNAVGGIQAIRFGYIQSYEAIQFQMRFDNPIPKDNTKTFSISMRISWARV